MTDLQLLDDPQWAIFHPQMAKAYRQIGQYRQELEQAAIVKCPRMGECLDYILEDFPHAQVVYLVRDPRDIYCSIAEAQRSADTTVTTMADNRRFGLHDHLWQGVSLAFKTYAQQAMQVNNDYPNRLTFIAYADLYQQPQSTLEGLCQHLYLDIVNAQVSSLAQQQLGPTRNKHQNDLSIKGANRWQHELSAETATAILELCGAKFSALRTQCQRF